MLSHSSLNHGSSTYWDGIEVPEIRPQCHMRKSCVLGYRRRLAAVKVSYAGPFVLPLAVLRPTVVPSWYGQNMEFLETATGARHWRYRLSPSCLNFLFALELLVATVSATDFSTCTGLLRSRIQLLCPCGQGHDGSAVFGRVSSFFLQEKMTRSESVG